MQILKVGKDLGRSAARGPGKDSQGLTWALIMGGEGLDKQFEALSEQPDM
jgi:ATP-dependent RNA helicase DDX54/DBP10